jgi:hypothetical protein
MPRLVEVEMEDDDGGSVTVGEWKRLSGDYWTLRITETDLGLGRVSSCSGPLGH